LTISEQRRISGHRVHMAGSRGQCRSLFEPRTSQTCRPGFPSPRVRPLMSLSATPTRPGIGSELVSTPINTHLN
jgi:hypothetical protein